MHRLSDILLPVLGIIVVTFSSLFFMLQYMARDADRVMLQSEASVLRAQLQDKVNDIVIVVEDNAVWDVSYDKYYLNPDEDWFRQSFGENEEYFNNVDGIFIYDQNDQVNFKAGIDTIPDAETFVASGLGDHLSTLTVSDYHTSIITSGLIEIDRRLFLYAGSLIQQFNNNPPQSIPAERRPVLIFIHELTDERVRALGDNIDMTNIHIHLEDASVPGYLALDQNVFENTFFTTNQTITVDWDEKAPGRSFFNRLIFPMIFVAVLVLLTFYYFFRRAAKLVEVVEGLDRMKSSFIANMSHEMRTPLNAIIGFCELLKSESFGKLGSDKNKLYVKYILESGTHLLGVINDILDISKVEAGKMDINKQAIHVRDLIDESVELFQPKIQHHGLTIQNHVMDIEILTDPKIFKQVVENIISNAIKFTPPGGHISLSSLFDREFIKISITDTGIGMSEKELATALSTFGQVEQDYARDVKGTGLGLSIVQKFMNLLGGKFNMTSKKDQGTTVTLSFPVINGTA